MARIVISGYYGFDNLGDEAVLAGIISALRQEVKESGLPQKEKRIDFYREERELLEIVVLSNQPEVTAARYQVESVYRNDLRAVLREISRCDLLISGGGSLLQDVTSWRTIPYYLSQVFFAQLRGKKTVFYAQGVGPIKGRGGRLFVRLIANRTDLITVRDRNSRDFFIGLGVDPGLIKITSDPVFALKGREWTESEKLLQEKGMKAKVKADIRKEKPLIGISVRPWGDNSYLEKVARTADFISGLTGGEIIIIPMHYRQDQEASRKLAGLLESKARILSDRYDPLEMLKLFAGLDFLLGVRLHSLIFAALQNLPFVALSYDPKVKGFLEMLGVNSLMELDDLDVESLKRVCQAVWENREKFITLLEHKMEDFYQQAIYNARLVLNLLNYK